MIHHLGQLIGDYGYVIVGLFIFFEGLAVPFPTDSTVVTAAAFAAHGRLSLAMIFLVSTLSAVGGTTVAFLAGRRGGTFFERHSRRVHPRVLERTGAFFDRHGGTAVIVGRFIPLRADADLADGGALHDEPHRASRCSTWRAPRSGRRCSAASASCSGSIRQRSVPGSRVPRSSSPLGWRCWSPSRLPVVGWWKESDAAWRAEGTLWHRLLTTAPLRWLAAHSPRARAFLFRRFSPADYLGLNLTLGLGAELRGARDLQRTS